MSRGPGSLQREVLKFVQEQTSPTTLENVRWALHENSNSGDLPKSSAFAVDRAVKSLASASQGHRLIVEKRKLGTLEEWVRHYPDKTHDKSVRQLRLDLLPTLATWMIRSDGPGPRFDTEENERFALHGEIKGFRGEMVAEKRRSKFGAEWNALEAQLWPHLVGASAEDVLYLLVRGRQLFTRSEVSATLAFGQLVERCAHKELLPGPLLMQLRSLADRFVPPEKVSFLAVKSHVYQCIQPVRIRQPDLKPDALKVLLEAKPDYMKGVAGFTPPGPRGKGMPFPEEERWRNAVARGSALSRMIDHSSFQNFSFLRAAP